MLTCRDATDQQQKVCGGLLTKMRERYKASPSDAESLLKIGDAPRDESADVVGHAAWTQLAATVLASDVAILMY